MLSGFGIPEHKETYIYSVTKVHKSKQPVLKSKDLTTWGEDRELKLHNIKLKNLVTALQIH